MRVPILFWAALIWISVDLLLLTTLSTHHAAWLYGSSLLALAGCLLLRLFKRRRIRKWQIWLLFAGFGSLSAGQGLLENSASKISGTPSGSWQAVFSSALQNTLKKQGFDNAETGLLCALICGDRSRLTLETKKDFQGSGVAHLLALSGLHIGILYQGLQRLLLLFSGFRCRNTRWQGGIILGLLWLYTFFTGCSPSILRAVIMCTCYEISGWREEPKNGLQALGISAILITCCQPTAPAQLSFQLSYLAMIGIFFIHPILSQLFHPIPWLPVWGNKTLKKLWNTLSITLSCQLATLPIILPTFRSFPMAFQLANLLTAPLIAWIIPCFPLILGGNVLWPDFQGLHLMLKIPLQALLKIVEIIHQFSP